MADAQPNYIVIINGRHRFPANTEDEAWDIIGRHPMGSLYEVQSPVGLPTGDFVPF